MYTFFFQKDPTFCHYNRYISVDKAFALFVHEGNRDICIFNADIERYTKNSGWGIRYSGYLDQCTEHEQ